MAASTSTSKSSSSSSSRASPLLGRIQTRQDLEKLYALPTKEAPKTPHFNQDKPVKTKVTFAGLPADAPDLRLDVVWLKRRTRLFRYYTPQQNERGKDCDVLTAARCNDADPTANPLFLTMSNLDIYGDSACVFMLHKKTPYLLLDYDNLGKLAYLLHHYPDVLEAHGIAREAMEEFLGMFYNIEPGFEEYIDGKVKYNRNVTKHDRNYFKNRLSFVEFDYLYFRRFKLFVKAIGCHGIVSPPKKEKRAGRPLSDFHEELVQYDCDNLTLLLSRPKAEKDEQNKYYWKHYGPLAEVVKRVNVTGGKTKAKGKANPRTSARTRPSP